MTDFATLAVLIVVFAWAYRDAEARGARGWAVGLLFIAFLPFSVLIWPLARPALLPPPDTTPPVDLEHFRVQ